MNVEANIREKLLKAFEPQHLEVVNESPQHNVPPGSESHFKVILVSDQFEGVARIQRQRQVNEVLAAELNGPVHALAQRVMTLKEFESSPEYKSPNCMGGEAPTN